MLALIGIFTQPDWISQTWNFENISGIFIFDIPLEEVIFAFTFGALWTLLYEYVYCYTLHKARKSS